MSKLWETQDKNLKMYLPMHPQHKQDNRPDNSNNTMLTLPVHALTAQQLGQQVVHLNWSYFKPEFSGKSDEDTEVHLLHTNDWMNTHHFIEGIKVQRFYFTLLGYIVSLIRTY